MYKIESSSLIYNIFFTKKQIMFISVLCLLFLIKLRWPKIKSFIHLLRYRYGDDTVDTFRSYEKHLLKYHKTGKDLWFLNQCKFFEITPTFLNIKFSNEDYGSLPICKKLKKDLLQHEINKK